MNRVASADPKHGTSFPANVGVYRTASVDTGGTRAGGRMSVRKQEKFKRLASAGEAGGEGKAEKDTNKV